jgi:ribosomal protein S12
MAQDITYTSKTPNKSKSRKKIKLHLINGYMVETNMTIQEYEQYLTKYKKHNTIYFDSVRLYVNNPKGNSPHYTNLTIIIDHIVCISQEYKEKH